MKDAPLREGFLLLIGLGLIAWPLSLVTGQAKVGVTEVVKIQEEDGSWVTDVEVQSAHPFTWMELRKGAEVLGRIEGSVAEGEFECLLAEQGELLTVAAGFPPGTPKTALKLQLWPGNLPEIELTFWSDGDLLQEVDVKFHE